MSSIGKGGAFKNLRGGSGGTGTAIGVGGSYKSILEMWIGQVGVWKRFFIASTLIVTATDVNETDTGSSASGPVSGQSTATPSGAVGTVTYLWQHVSTSSGNTPSISSATAQSPTFTATVADGVNSVSTWKVTATDDNGSDEDTITVTLNWNDVAVFTVTANDVDVTDSGTGTSGQVVGQSTAVPSGEVGAVTYLWEHVGTTSGDVPVISESDIANPTFTATVNRDVDSVTTWVVTAEDAEGSIDSDTVTVTLRWTDTDGDVPNVTDIAVSSSNPGAFCRSGARFNDDGSITELGPTLADETSIHNGEWYPTEPQPNIGSSHDIRCQSLTSGTWSNQAAAVGTWVSLSTSPAWLVNVSGMASPDAKQCVAQFQIRRSSDNVVVDSFELDALGSN